MLQPGAVPELFDEMKRYVRLGPADEVALRRLSPVAAPHFPRIAEEFYDRLKNHPEAMRVFTGPEQVARLKNTLREWMALLLRGPWDDAYYQLRRRIGHMHVRVGLPQRYMFGAMNQISSSLVKIAEERFVNSSERLGVVDALSKILHLELMVMLETYREAFVDKVQLVERQEKLVLEQQLAVSEARYGEIVEKAEALIITTGTEGHIMLFNRRCEEVLGLKRTDAAGRNWLELVASEEERPQIAERCGAALDGRRVTPFEASARSSDQKEHRIKWHLTTLPGGAEPILCAIGLDVTEERELAQRTRRAERLASLGTMAAGLAHEIRNPLNAAHLQLTLMQRRIGRIEGPEVAGVRQAADLAATEMKRLAALVEEFLQFARPQPLRLAKSNLRATAEEVVALIAPEAEAQGVDLMLEPGPAPALLLDDERLKQVILNLVRNAIEATGRGGCVRLEIEVRPGEAALLVVDDGPGLPSLDAPIFEPFYTTKQGGTGLGLAIVHRIISDHGGRIGLESRPGKTTFSVLLPLKT